ncbi:MAG: MvdC/MvdD family ATP grasp protein [Pseudomonadota bacterium]
MGYVIIIAPEDDLHAKVVSWELNKRGQDHLILSLRDYPQNWSLSLKAGHSFGSDYDLRLASGHRLSSSDIVGVWWRRTQYFDIPKVIEDAKHREFCIEESKVAIDGWMHAIGQKMINPIHVERTIRNKPYQLTLAQKAGLTVPDTLISNDPADVERFYEHSADGLIFKVLSNYGGLQTPFTQNLTDDMLQNLASLQSSPCLFQQRILGGHDLRITVVDDQIFPCEIHISAEAAKVDWRIDPNSQTFAHKLDPELAQKLLHFHKLAGLRYGAYDFRQDEKGTYWFLEVNSAGQYLWLETEADLPISAALADALIRSSD